MTWFVRKTIAILEFFFFYMIKVIHANFELAYHILSPRLNLKPGILKVPVSLSNEQAILLLINMISMTPGTLTMDLTDDKKYIFVHALFIEDKAKTMGEIKKLENKIEKLFGNYPASGHKVKH